MVEPARRTPGPTPAPLTVDPEQFRQWNPAAQEKALDALRRARNDAWRPFYCPATDDTGKPNCNGKPHDQWTWNHARGDQHPPADPDWVVWLLLSGRGSGKTRAGSEFTHRMTRVTGRIALVGPTGPDARDIMVEGEAGLLNVAPPGGLPHFEPSKRKLTWPNGAQGQLFSAEEPDRLRGPEHGFAWIDEPAHYPLIQDVWDNLMFGLRIGRRPRVACTTTPKPRAWVKETSADPRTRIARASTYANLDNLAPSFAERILQKYEGTRLGRQELHGEILEDVEGALWTWDLIEPDRRIAAPELSRVIVSVDPAGSVHKNSDETGIVVMGRLDDELFLLADRSGKYSPYGWAMAVDHAYDDFDADAVVAEDNYGGDMVELTLKSAGVGKRILRVHSRRGKALRAEPIVGLAEQHKIHHVGVFEDLENELTTWRPLEDSWSPNRLDAYVHGATNLMGRAAMSDIATPAGLRRLRVVS